MNLTLELDPDIDSTLRALARAECVSVELYVQRLIAREARRASRAAATTLLRQWTAEDGTANSNELARRERAWDAFREAMNRSRASDRKLYP